MRKVLTVIGLNLLLMMSCADSKLKEESVSDVPPYFVSADDVKQIYGFYVAGDYASYIECMMQSAEMTPEYKAQMLVLLKQHAADQKKEAGDVKSVEVARLVPYNKWNGAEAYLNVTYEKGATEEVMLQLVYDGSRWRLR